MKSVLLILFMWAREFTHELKWSQRISKIIVSVCCALLKQLDVSSKVASHTALATTLQNEVVIGVYYSRIKNLT